MLKHRAALAAAFAAMGILFAGIVNFTFSPGYVWFHHAAFALLWLPLAAFCMPRRNVGFALAGSALTIAYLVAVNLQSSPGHPWFLYAVLPLAMWPILILSWKRLGTLLYALVCSAVTVAYYAALNVLVSPGYPWAVFPAFAVAWWPLTLLFAKRRAWFGYSVAGSLWISALVVFVNLVSSPGAIWAVYPVFALAWWPLSMYWFRHRRGRSA